MFRLSPSWSPSFCSTFPFISSKVSLLSRAILSPPAPCSPFIASIPSLLPSARSQVLHFSAPATRPSPPAVALPSSRSTGRSEPEIRVTHLLELRAIKEETRCLSRQHHPFPPPPSFCVRFGLSGPARPSHQPCILWYSEQEHTQPGEQWGHHAKRHTTRRLRVMHVVSL